MKKNLRYLAIAAAGAVAALGFSSCAYDPYYSGASVSGTYSTGTTGSTGSSSGYGDGYGYGGSSFSTSIFVGTGDPRWGYDPYNYSYYDYHRRCYYDPYLHGYYPIGYRPPVVYGVPHPHGWSRGHGHIRPPSRVTNVTVVNYHNREAAYRKTNYGWARQVRQGPVNTGRVQAHRPQQNSRDRKNPQNYNPRPNTGSYRPNTDAYNRSSRYQGAQPSRQQAPKPAIRQQNPKPPTRQQNHGQPNRYNTPVNHQQAKPRQEQRATQPRENRRKEERQATNNKQKNKDDKAEENRGRPNR